MACSVDNNAYEFDLTPSRKRKRTFEKDQKINGLTNDGFSSTPKKEAKILIDSFNSFKRNSKEITFNGNSCLEVKSIAEIAAGEQDKQENPYEIVRKPPKKKKKSDKNEVCFINPGLNLECPDNKFNPFEVKRELPKIQHDKGCINPGLNIRTPETNSAINPYEIARFKRIENQKCGIENPCLEMPSSTNNLAIGLPFTPTVGCRIDFSNVVDGGLTPSKLFSEKLVFSPTNVKLAPTSIGRKGFQRRSLSVISEETTDIGKELDCYQLELENSINEAKLKKNNIFDIETFENRLQEVNEDTNININVSMNVTNVVLNITEDTKTIDEDVQTKTEQLTQIEEETISEPENKDVSYDSSFNDDIDFKAPTPFVRAYRKPNNPVIITTNTSTESLKQNDNNKEHKNKITQAIRKSVRKLIHPNEKKINEIKISSNEEINKDENQSNGYNFLETIRHSLRRRPKPKIIKNEINMETQRDISILDNTIERKIFRTNLSDKNSIQTDGISSDGFNKKLSLRSSLRKSTKGLKNQVMKNVFKKNIEEYDFKK